VTNFLRHCPTIELASTGLVRYRLSGLKFQKRQIALVVVAGLILALGLGAILYRRQARRALADYQKQLVANGEQLAIEELTPPAPPPAEDGTGNRKFPATPASTALTAKVLAFSTLVLGRPILAAQVHGLGTN
jgi:hypothetical protein